MTIQNALPALAGALGVVPSFAGITAADLEPLPTTGLAHDHVRIRGAGRLLRVPKQSQMRLDARSNLDYQAACFTRAGDSGAAPRYFGQLRPGETLPMGALIVEEIVGPLAVFPDDMGRVAQALAAIHALPVPGEEARPPLADHADPYAATLEEVREQARAFDAAALDPAARKAIEAEIAAAEAHAEALAAPAPLTLISFDAHPGNFLIREDTGRAVLVDLEKARYGAAGFDLAHATLYTSTTWDVGTYSEPSHDEIAGFYQAWLDALPSGLAEAQADHLMALRRLMWLWSVSWCAKWRVESLRPAKADKRAAESAEDWSAENSEAALVDHVRDRTAHYLAPETVERVRADWRERNALSDLLGRLAG
ncbi:MAG: phosphotransferase [Marivibrio sp.]|uniref:phosphotransferase n=1 Tax=Marivibrio sp. TaxID=2039719 RepID=UPI0032EEDEEA